MENCQSSGKDLLEAKKRLTELLQTKLIKSIYKALGKNAELHLVGGFVRDSILKIPNEDIDLSCKFNPEKSISLLKKAGLKVYDTGIEHGTIRVVLGSEQAELTTFRLPGNRNSKAYSETILEDLKGRDFTINAIAFSFNSLELIDPYKGIKDLDNNILKAVGKAFDRFSEDPLRILRFIRFGAASDRECGEEIKLASTKLAKELKSVSPERIRDELRKIMLSNNPKNAFILMEETKILDIILPEFRETVGFEQNEFHIHDVFNHLLEVISRTSKNELLRWTALFHDIGKPQSLSIGEDGRRHFYKHELISEKICKTVMKRLCFSKKFIKDVSLLVAYHMRPLECGPAAVRRLMRDLGPLLDPWMEFNFADKSPTISDEDFYKELNSFKKLLDKEIKKAKEKPYGKLAINGHDLLALGFKENKKLGDLIKNLEEIVIEDPSKNTKEYLFSFVKKRLS